MNVWAVVISIPMSWLILENIGPHPFVGYVGIRGFLNLVASLLFASFVAVLT